MVTTKYTKIYLDEPKWSEVAASPVWQEGAQNILREYNMTQTSFCEKRHAGKNNRSEGMVHMWAQPGKWRQEGYIRRVVYSHSIFIIHTYWILIAFYEYSYNFNIHLYTEVYRCTP